MADVNEAVERAMQWLYRSTAVSLSCMLAISITKLFTPVLASQAIMHYQSS